MARLFKDTEGREWVVTINVAAMKRVRSLLGVDLYKLVDDGLSGLSALLADPCKFVDVLFVLSSASHPEVSDCSFGESLGGDSLNAASDAFVEELIDFFPQAEARKSLREILAKGKRVGEKALTVAMVSVREIDEEAVVKRLLNGKRWSGNSLESLESIPAS